MKITFGIIVLNGEPFTRYTLRALYPFAHEIIVVEGAAPGARAVATPEGHSRDGTLEVLRRFKAEEDPDDKLQIVTRDGFWPEKDAMSQAYAERATGDYLWQVDIDEFYQPEDMRLIIEMLRDDPSISCVLVEQITFWGALDVTADGWFLRLTGLKQIPRVFKWGPGYAYVSHRPVTIHDEQGRDMRHLNPVEGYTLAQRHGVYMYHYSLLLPKQVHEKSSYYRYAGWAKRSEAEAWAEGVYTRLERPYRVHNAYDHPSWLARYHGEHPPQIRAMWEDITSGQLDIHTRQMDDAYRLLRSPGYILGREWLKAAYYLDRLYHRVRGVARRILRGSGSP